MDKQSVKELTEEELRICINEYMRRYRSKNKSKVSFWNKRYNAKRLNRKVLPMGKRLNLKNKKSKMESIYK